MKEKNRIVVRNETEVSYSAVDRENLMKPVEAARIFQNLFLEQDRIMNTKGTEDETGWILLNYDMNIYSYPSIGDRVTAVTYPYSFNRFYGNRIFILEDEKGEILVEAKTRWLFVDRSTLSIKRVTPEIAGDFGDFGIDRGRGFTVEALKEDLLSEAEGKPLSVRHDDIDFNSHVNHTVYFSLFYDYTPIEILEAFRPYKIQIMYKKQLLEGDSPEVRSIQYLEDLQQYTEYEIIEGEDVCTTIKVLWKKR